jgi:hypothetical protein
MKAQQPWRPTSAQEATMLHIDLTTEERDLLEQMLDACLIDLRGEVSATHSHQYKEDLKQREALLRKIIAAVHEAGELEPS